MKRMALLISTSALAVLGVAFVGSAGATHDDSTVGSVVCGSAVGFVVCDGDGPSPIYGDWGGYQHGASGNEDPNGYHCRNLLHVGSAEDYGNRSGTTYYTVGDPGLLTDDFDNESDCTLDGDSEDDAELSDDSLVLFRFVTYFNFQTGDQHNPNCDNYPDRNDGCDNGEDAVYFGYGLEGADAGARGDIPEGL